MYKDSTKAGKRRAAWRHTVVRRIIYQIQYNTLLLLAGRVHAFCYKPVRGLLANQRTCVQYMLLRCARSGRVERAVVSPCCVMQSAEAVASRTRPHRYSGTLFAHTHSKAKWHAMCPQHNPPPDILQWAARFQAGAATVPVVLAAYITVPLRRGCGYGLATCVPASVCE